MLFYKMLASAKNQLAYIRGYIVKVLLLMLGCKVGPKLRCTGWPRFRSIPYKNIVIGENVSIGTNVTFLLSKSGKIILNDYCRLFQDIVISANTEVAIGKGSGVAEFCSIRDADHGNMSNANMREQELFSEPINIGDDVQISRGCAIFKGVKIEDGVIIGANILIFKNFKSVKNGIYLGNPPRLILKRR